MLYIAAILYVLLWSVAGYFVGKTVYLYFATKRMEREFSMYMNTHPLIKVASKEES